MKKQFYAKAIALTLAASMVVPVMAENVSDKQIVQGEVPNGDTAEGKTEEAPVVDEVEEEVNKEVKEEPAVEEEQVEEKDEKEPVKEEKEAVAEKPTKKEPVAEVTDKNAAVEHNFGAWDYDEESGNFVRSCADCEETEESEEPEEISSLLAEIEAAEDSEAVKALTEKAVADGIITESVAEMINATTEVSVLDTTNTTVDAEGFQPLFDSETVKWKLEDGVFTVKGSGEIATPNGDNTSRPWYNDRQNITKIVIKDGITRIENLKCFSDLPNLTELELPDTLEYIGTGSFATCPKLKSVTIPESVTTMSSVVFSNCTGLEKLYIKNRTMSSPVNDKWSTSADATFKLPENLTVYGYQYTDDSKTTETDFYKYVKYNNDNENSINKINFIAYDGENSGRIGESDTYWSYDDSSKTLTVFGEGQVPSLSNQIGPDGKSGVAPWQNHINDIKKLVIDEGITSTEAVKSFADISNLKEVSFPSSFTTIGSGAFAGCGFETLTIPLTVTKLSDVAFTRCKNLKSLYFENRNIEVPDPNTGKWESGVNTTQSNLIVYGYKYKDDTKKETTALYDYVTKNGITFAAYDDTGSQVGTSGVYWKYDDGVLTLTGTGKITINSGEEKPWKDYTNNITKIVINEGITGTAGVAKILGDLPKLKEVVIPDSFTTLGSGCFANTALTDVTLGENVTSMDSVSFSGCMSLNRLVVKNRNLNVNEQGPWCSDPDKNPLARIPGDLTVYGYRYTDDKNTTETKLYKFIQYNNTTLGANIKFVDLGDENNGNLEGSEIYWNYNEGVLTLTGKGTVESTLTIENIPWLEKHQKDITKMVISEGITGSGSPSKILGELPNLKEVVIPDSFTTLGGGCFANTALTNVTLGENVTTMNAVSFSGCMNLKTLTVKNRNINVPEDYWCSSPDSSPLSRIPHNLTVYGYKYTDETKKETTKLYRFIEFNNKFIKSIDGNVEIKFVDLDAYASLLNGLEWSYDDENKTLTISGKGEIGDFTDEMPAPWKDMDIENVEIEKGVTGIGAKSFDGLRNLKTITIARSVEKIASNAMPKTVKIIAKRNSEAKNFAKANGNPFEEMVTANVLFIGNSYTEDAREYIRYVFDQYNYPEDSVKLGHLYSGGKTVAYYANCARQESNYSTKYGNSTLDTESERATEEEIGDNKLYYNKSVDDKVLWTGYGEKKILDAMSDEDWDMVIIQGHDVEQMYGSTYNKNFGSNLTYLTNYIKDLDPTVEIGYYMTWRRNFETVNDRLAKYWETMRNTVEKNKNVDFIIHVGTAVENARTTYLDKIKYNYTTDKIGTTSDGYAKVNLIDGTNNIDGKNVSSLYTNDTDDGLQRDGTHMSAVLGRFLVGYTMGEKITDYMYSGDTDANISKETNISDIYSHDTRIGKLPTEYVNIVKDSYKAAKTDPYKVTDLSAKYGAVSPATTAKNAIDTKVASEENYVAKIVKGKTADEYPIVIKTMAENILTELKAAYTELEVGDVTVDTSTSKDTSDRDVTTYTASIPVSFGYDTVTATVTWSSIKITKPTINAVYDVEYYKENLDGTYEKVDADCTRKSAELGSEVTAEEKDYDHYVLNKEKSKLSGTVIKPKVEGEGENAKVNILTLKVYYDLDEHNVAFDLKDGSEASVQTIKHGKTAEKPADPGRTGFRFLGWFADENLTTKFDFSQAIEEDTTVYAGWKKKSSDGGDPSYTGGSSSSGSSSSLSSKNEITADKETENGSIKLDKDSASKGSKVTITVTPNEGYETEKVTVTDKNGKEIEVKDNGNGTYTFTMPSTGVDVNADFKETAGNDAEKEPTVITMQIGSKDVSVNEKTITNDVAPVIRNNRTLVPIRVITETLGGTVDWDDATKTVTLNIDGKEIKMTIGVILEKYGVAPAIINDRTYVPIRFVADELGAEVQWNDETKTVTVTKK